MQRDRVNVCVAEEWDRHSVWFCFPGLPLEVLVLTVSFIFHFISQHSFCHSSVHSAQLFPITLSVLCVCLCQCSLRSPCNMSPYYKVFVHVLIDFGFLTPASMTTILDCPYYSIYCNWIFCFLCVVLWQR